MKREGVGDLPDRALEEAQGALRAKLEAGEPQKRPGYDLLCRVYNFIAALAGLVLFSPLIIMTALLIKIFSGSPVLYRGLRVGRNGKYFRIFKFRTMRLGVEREIGATLVDPEEDPHLTPIGRILRKRKLDEFPQLLNVLRGEMNLVGPRPVRPVFLRRFLEEIPGYHLRFQIKPGITGFAQLRKGYYLPPRNKLRYELIYRSRRSLALDLIIIVLTFSRLLSRLFTGFGLLIVLVLFASFMPKERLFGFYVRFAGMEINILFVYLLLGGLFFILTHIKREISFMRTPLDLLFLGFAGVTLLSAFFSPRLGAGVKEWAYLIITSFGLFYFIVNGLNINKEEMKIFLKSYAVIILLAAAAGYYGCFWAWRANITESPFYHPEMLILFFTPWFSFFAWLAKEGESRIGRGMAAVIFTAAGLAVFFTFPAWGLVSALAGVSVFFLRYSRKLLFPLFAVLMILVASFSGRFPLRPLLGSEDKPGPNSLAYAFRNAVIVLENNQRYLLLGAGVGPWWDRLREAPSSEIDQGRDLAARRFGCMYLTILARNGILGLSFFLGFLTGILRFLHDGCRKVKDRFLRSFLWAVFSGSISVMIVLLFSDAFYFVSVQVSFWLLIGLAAAVIIRFGEKRLKRYHIWQYRY